MLSCNIGNYLIKRQSERYIIMSIIVALFSQTLIGLSIRGINISSLMLSRPSNTQKIVGEIYHIHLQNYF